MADGQMERRIMKRMSALMAKNEIEVSVQLLLAEQALKVALTADLKKEWLAGRGGATTIVVPSRQWVPHLATAVEDIRGDLHVLMRLDAKKREEESAAVGRVLASGRGVVAVTPSADYLPALFKTVNDRTLEIALTPAIVAPVVRIVGTGRLPRSFSDLNVGVLDMDEVCSLIVPGSLAADIHARIERAILAKSSMSRPGENLPDMEEATEFGLARVWAMDLKQDLADFQAQKIEIGDVDKGIILHGPPGTGKTLFAKSLGEYLGIPVIISGMSEFFASSAGYLDSVVKAQREVFDRARAQKPCILFLDELDATPDLDKIDRNAAWWAPVVNDFLSLLDGATSDRSGVIVVGATNRLHAVPMALRRPGRFEREVYLGLPDQNGIARILRHHLGSELVGCDLNDIAQRCVSRSMSAADLMERVRSAKRKARRAKRPMIMADLKNAIVPVDTRSRHELRRVSIHEAGHALIAGILCPELLVSVDIEQDIGGVGGSTNMLPPSTVDMTESLLNSQIKVLLGGRAAEIVALGENSAGSGGGYESDLHKATALAAMSTMSFGLGAPRWRCKPEDAVAHLALDPALRSAVEGQLSAAAHAVESLLVEHVASLQSIADALLEERMLSGARVVDIIAGLEAVPKVPAIAH